MQHTVFCIFNEAYQLVFDTMIQAFELAPTSWTRSFCDIFQILLCTGVWLLLRVLRHEAPDLLTQECVCYWLGWFGFQLV